MTIIMLLRRLLPLLPILLLSLVTAPAQAVQTCPAGNDLVTPNTDLVDNGNATVTHSKTGLTWKQCSEGLSGVSCATGAATALTWSQALGAATPLNVGNFAGQSDWRLPNDQELASIVETGCYSPSINATRFPNTVANGYWTSTSNTAPSFAGFVNFFDGTTFGDGKSSSFYYVRLVRGGQSFGAFDSLGSGCKLDIDGNGVQDALTDGLLIIRALFGLTGTAVTNGAIGGGSPTRTTWAQIQPYLNGSCGANFSP